MKQNLDMLTATKNTFVLATAIGISPSWKNEVLEWKYSILFSDFFRQIRTDVEIIDNWHSLGEKIQALVQERQEIDDFLSEVGLCSFSATPGGNLNYTELDTSITHGLIPQD